MRARSSSRRASTRSVAAVALKLLEEYAPPRPVRLLGVRVAGLTHGESADESGERAGRHDGAGGESEAASAAGSAGGDDPRAQMALPV